MKHKLSFGDSGPDVVSLQKALANAGFSAGVQDGEFGSGTFNALSAFQQSERLLEDGIAGPRTLDKLGLVKSASLPDATENMTVQIASQMLPGAPLANIKANLPLILNSLRTFQIGDRPMVLMAIATIRAETASCMQLVRAEVRITPPLPAIHSTYTTTGKTLETGDLLMGSVSREGDSCN